MLSLQWVTVVQKICPTDGLRVSWPAQLVLDFFFGGPTRLRPGTYLVRSTIKLELRVGSRGCYRGYIASVWRCTTVCGLWWCGRDVSTQGVRLAMRFSVVYPLSSTIRSQKART